MPQMKVVQDHRPGNTERKPDQDHDHEPSLGNGSRLLLICAWRNSVTLNHHETEGPADLYPVDLLDEVDAGEGGGGVAPAVGQQVHDVGCLKS